MAFEVGGQSMRIAAMVLKLGYTNEYVRLGDIASTEGAKLRLPKARNPLRLGGMGERRKLPSGVWGGAPEILNISCQNGVHFGMLLISYFLTIKSKK